jgi:hypothetical protein
MNGGQHKMSEYDNDSKVIVEKIYPLIASCLDKNDSKFRANIGKFMTDRHDQLFDIAPYDRIYYNQTDIDSLFKSLGCTEKEVKELLIQTFYYNLPINPQCAKEPYVIATFMAIRYYMKKNQQKNADLTCIYLAFSGKFYASLHALYYRTTPPSKYRAVMDYVVNNMLTDKYDLKREGTVFGAIKSICTTYDETYKKDIVSNDLTDKKTYLLLQQLRGRENSFFKNIANLYYEAFKNRSYLNYETDNLSEENFRLTSNDSATATRITESAMNYLTSNYVSIDICNKCKDQYVKATEIKDIMESILSDNNNLPSIRRVVNILICDFMINNPDKKIYSVEFISYSIKAKPNTKDKYLIELKNIILGWLDESSPNYRKRKSRKATAQSYYRSILMYFVLVISKVSK